LDFLLLRSERLALRSDTTALLLELLNPSAQSGIHHTQRTARLDVAVALIQNQSRSLSFELGGKSTSLLAHQTPLYRRDFRLNRCPGSVDHYRSSRRAPRRQGNKKTCKSARLLQVRDGAD